MKSHPVSGPVESAIFVIWQEEQPSMNSACEVTRPRKTLQRSNHSAVYRSLPEPTFFDTSSHECGHQSV